MGCPISRPRHVGSPDPDSPAVSSKTAVLTGPGRLPSPSAPSPGRAPRFRVVRVGSRGARHRCRCSRASWLSPLRPGFRRVFTPGAATREGAAEGARPMAFRLDRAPLVDFCNQHSPRARPQTAQSPSGRGPSVRLRARSPASPRRSRLPPPPCSAETLLDDGAATRNGWRRRSGLPHLFPFREGPLSEPHGLRDTEPFAPGRPQRQRPGRHARVLPRASGPRSNWSGYDVNRALSVRSRGTPNARPSRMRRRTPAEVSRARDWHAWLPAALLRTSAPRFPAISHPRSTTPEDGPYAVALAGDWETPLPQPDPLGHLSS